MLFLEIGSLSTMWKPQHIQKVIIITLCWTTFMSFTYISSYLFVDDLIRLEKLSGAYAFWPDFAGNVILGIIGGLIGG